MKLELKEKSKMKTGIQLIAEEREKQLKRWSLEHDDEHTAFEISSYAASHIAHAQNVDFKNHTHYDGAGNVARFQVRLIDEETEDGESIWENGNPFDQIEDKTSIESLVIAGALIAAEIDRLQRLNS